MAEGAMLAAGDLVYCSATAYRLPFVDKVEAAAAAGFDGISLLISDYLGAREAGLSDAQLVGLVRDTGLEIAEVSSVTRWLDSGGVQDEEEELVLRLVGLFDALGFNCTPLNGTLGDIDDAAAAFGAVCDRAARQGARCQIEFFPWSTLGDLPTTWEIVRRADRPNGGIMLDTWHHYRSGGTAAGLRSVPGEVIFGIQLADAPAVPTTLDLQGETSYRLLPGAGDADVVGCLRVMDEMGVRAPYGGEPINVQWAELPAAASAEAVHGSLTSVLRRAGIRT
jgi:sugar phosphate isomerase/epimerase